MAPYTKGDIIVRSVPFAGGPIVDSGSDSSQQLLKFCYACYRPEVSKMLTEDECEMQQCTECKQISYCSTECQQRDSIHHRLECAYLVKAQRNPKFGAGTAYFWLDSETRIFARVLLRLGRADDVDDALVARFLKLDAHLQDENRAAAGVEASTIDTIRQYLVGHAYTSSLTDGQLKEIVSRTQYHWRRTNLGAISVEEKIALVCVEISEMQHSCASNASMVLREDGCVYVIANRTIESDADVRVTIVNNLMAGKQRRWVRLRRSKSLILMGSFPKAKKKSEIRKNIYSENTDAHKLVTFFAHFSTQLPSEGGSLKI